MQIPSERTLNRLWFLLVCLIVGTVTSPLFLKDSNLPLTALKVECGFVLVLGLVAFLDARQRTARDLNAQSKQMEEEGLFILSDYRARRAFQVEDTDDLGIHYFVELEDLSVLHLSGQYLYDYEPIDDDGDANQPRRFPCTDFTVRRHRTAGYVVDIICRGEVLEPEVIAAPYTLREIRQDLVPEDGGIIADRSYDEIKRERTRQ